MVLGWKEKGCMISTKSLIRLTVSQRWWSPPFGEVWCLYSLCIHWYALTCTVFSQTSNYVLCRLAEVSIAVPTFKALSKGSKFQRCCNIEDMAQAIAHTRSKHTLRAYVRAILFVSGANNHTVRLIQYTHSSADKNCSNKRRSKFWLNAGESQQIGGRQPNKFRF